MLLPDMRICSLLPSATEIVFSLGLGDRLIAVTHECDYPDEARRLPAITRSIMPHTTGGNREIQPHISRARHTGINIYGVRQGPPPRRNPQPLLSQGIWDC